MTTDKTTPLLEVLYEDHDLLALHKPSGLPTQGTRDPKVENLYQLAQNQFKHYLGLHHRLDVGTSGVVVFTKNKEINKSFQEIFKNRLAQKTYLALTHLSLNSETKAINENENLKEWTVKNHLGPHPKSSARKTWYTAVRSGGDFAHTDFKILETYSQHCLVEAQPHTGRTHQIRVHLFEGGTPILGDQLYFNKEIPRVSGVRRLMLHAHKIEFPHPKTNKLVQITSPIPRDFARINAR